MPVSSVRTRGPLAHTRKFIPQGVYIQMDNPTMFTESPKDDLDLALLGSTILTRVSQAALLTFQAG